MVGPVEPTTPTDLLHSASNLETSIEDNDRKPKSPLLFKMMTSYRQDQSTIISKSRVCIQKPKDFPTSRWKENLRRSCLENARKRRRELVLRKRLAAAHSESNQENALSAKELVVGECQKYGYGIQLSCSEFRRNRKISKDLEMTELETKYLDDYEKQLYTLTDDDINDILRDVEEELEKDEELLLEEVLEAERHDIQDQIDEFEEWEDKMDPDGCIPCPVCQSTHLKMSPEEGIICCQDEDCPVRIRAAQVENPLLYFRNELGMLHESHASQCSSLLSFKICTNSYGCVLIASCEDCYTQHQFE